MLEVSSIFVSMAILIFLAYRRFSVLVLAPLAAASAVLISGGESLLGYYTQIFMVKLGDFATIYFPLFLLSAIFGKIMESSGSAKAIAHYLSEKIGPENAILAVVLSCSVLTYGGVSLFVVAFAVYPIAVELFKKSDTPKRLIPGAVAIGSFTFTMVGLPGTPAIQNAIPAQYFGTNTFAAPGLGFVASIIMFVLGMAWMNRQLTIARSRKEGYGEHRETVATTLNEENTPDFWVALFPIILVVLINYACVKWIFPQLDMSYLHQEKYGNVDIKNVASNWAVIVAVFTAVVFLLICHYRNIDVTKCLNGGATDSLAPIFNTASVVGYGAVINALPGFVLLRDGVIALSSGDPVISGSIITGILSAITGSASGGLSITLEMLGSQLLTMAQQLHISPEALHRIISLSCSTLHALPHNGAVITLFAICGLTHKDSYKDIFVTSLCITVVSTLVTVLVYKTFGAF
ncbi:MAG: GntP family permease [Holosporaceae bacterium]|jgi:H+/gluconate symporter-like permease|nr:GntP family permease [Holosporaceae bacterium]